MAARGALSWQWSRFGLGVLYAVPTIVVAPFDPAVALALSIGVLPAAVVGLPPRRRARAAIPFLGALVALGLLLGAALALVPVLAVLALALLSVGASMLAARGRAGQLALTLVLPLVGIGLSFPFSAATIAVAAAILAGSVYAWLVALLWPERSIGDGTPAAVPKGRAMVVYGVLLGAAAATAAAIGFALGLEHVGWATGAVLLVMRPVRGQLVLRSVGRATSVLVGALAAAGFAVLSPNGAMVGVAIGLTLGSLCAVQESRWYVAPAFTTFLVLTLLLSTSAEPPAARFLERTLETLLGIALALFFGALVPALLAMRRPEGAKVSE
ncbi:FUSC family protein [Zhihengliuella sp. ISTPL4]|uniref:FUSC family protein n=1 Tax=Zhihengliuella sp. ISTPL4 TaxID=2058657 RepID=UPI000C7B33FB|nr:FUSC family protein [Zhihengliuella sp. ISTPL4]